MISESSSCSLPATVLIRYLAATPAARRTVTSPETVLIFASSGMPVMSRKILPEMLSERNFLISPDAVTSPLTVLAVTSPAWLRTDSSPLTAFSSRSPRTLSTTTSPLTVLILAFSALVNPALVNPVLVNPERPLMNALAETTPNLRATSLGTMMLTSALALPRTDAKTSMKLSQSSCGWSTSRVSPSMETFNALPRTECTSTRAPGSSWPTMSTCPAMRLTLSVRTRSMSMTLGPSTIHFSCAIVVPLIFLRLGAVADARAAQRDISRL